MHSIACVATGRKFIPRVAGLWLLTISFPAIAAAALPAWWGSPAGPAFGIYDESQTQSADNWAIANIGQLKRVATKANEHLSILLGLGAADWNPYYPTGNNSFPLPLGTSLDNYGPANVGQLKFVALGFYKLIQARRGSGYIRDRLMQMGVTTIGIYDGTVVPWEPSDENYGPITIGQLKAVFSFDLALTNEMVQPGRLSIPEWMRAALSESGSYGSTFVVANVPLEDPGTAGATRLQLLLPQ